METLVEAPPAENPGLEIKRSRRLRGNLSFRGDAHLSMLAVSAAALGPEPSRFENLPEAPWFAEFRAALEALGARCERGEGHWLVSGGELRTPETPVRPPTEMAALILAGLASGSGLRVQFDLGSPAIAEDLRALLAKLYPAPGELYPKARVRPAEFGDETAVKTVLAFHHLAARQPLELRLRKPGSGLLETVLGHFGAEAKVDKDGEEGDELSRRIARQMRAAGKAEPQATFRLIPGSPKAAALTLPGDVGEAAAAALAATLIKGSDLILENVLLNAGRAAIFTALRRMGADLEVTERRERFGEAQGSLRVRSSDLIGKRFDGEALGEMREEVFLLLLAAAFAEGESVFRDLDYLRGGETDRLKGFIAALKGLGVEIGELEDGLVLRGRGECDGGSFDAQGHPGLGTAYAVLALKAHGASTLRGLDGLESRHPDLLAALEAASQERQDKA